jgi:hypothetical protein
MKMEQIVCSETSAYKIQTPGNHPEENIQHNVYFNYLFRQVSYSLNLLKPTGYVMHHQFNI